MFGKPVAGPPEGVAMVFQHFGLLPWKTVYQNAAFGLSMAGAPASYVRERVRHYLDLVGLTGFEQHYPYQLSGGMQQRVGLVRALAVNPSILLDGRAVRRARCPDPRNPAGRAAAIDATPRRAQDDGVHHPFHRRGDRAGRPHRGDDGAPRAHQGDPGDSVRPTPRRRGGAGRSAVRRAARPHLAPVAHGAAQRSPAQTPADTAGEAAP